ncbi:hypothetical protein GCM10027299_12650 [Larkinella ripae]
MKLKLALVKMLEIIGEAVHFIAKETRNEFTEVKWNTRYVALNSLVQKNFGIN